MQKWNENEKKKKKKHTKGLSRGTQTTGMVVQQVISFPEVRLHCQQCQVLSLSASILFLVAGLLPFGRPRWHVDWSDVEDVVRAMAVGSPIEVA